MRKGISFFIQFFTMGENGGSQVKSGTWENRMKPLHGPKRRNKPLVEKKRRARINDSLAQLKALVLESMQKNHTGQYSKLEKADILEMTVKHLVQLKQQVNDKDLVSKYHVGYNQCASEVVRYLGQSHNTSTETRTRLVNHLSQRVEPGQYSATTQPHYESETETQPRSGSYLMMLQSESNMAPLVTNNTVYATECSGSYGNCYTTNIQNTQNTNILQSTNVTLDVAPTENTVSEESSTYVQINPYKLTNQNDPITYQNNSPVYLMDTYNNRETFVTGSISKDISSNNMQTNIDYGQGKERQDNTFDYATANHTYTNLHEMPLDKIAQREIDLRLEQSNSVLSNINNETSLIERDYYSNLSKEVSASGACFSNTPSPKGQLPPFQVFRETLRQNSRAKKQERVPQQHCVEKQSTNLIKRYKLGLVNGNHPSTTENTTMSQTDEENATTSTANDELHTGGILGLGSGQVWRPW